MTPISGNQKQRVSKVYFRTENLTFRNLFDGNDTYFSDEHAFFIAKLYNQTQEFYQDGLIDKDNEPEEIIEHLSAFEDWIWVIYQDEKPVGLIAIDSWDWINDYLHACSLHVWCIKDKFSVQAMSKAAHFMTQELVRRGLKRIYTYLDEENKGGIRFYQSLGYEIEGLLKARVLLKGMPRNEYILAYVSL